MLKGPQKSLVGQKFGRLLVLEIARTSEYGYFYTCKCDCGKLCEKNGSKMKLGHVKSCGCQRDENLVNCNANRAAGEEVLPVSWKGIEDAFRILNSIKSVDDAMRILDPFVKEQS